MGTLRSFVWPNRSQELLLDVALGPQEEAVSTFQRWKAETDLDREFDWGTFRLLPLVYERLRGLDVDDPLMGRLKGIYRLAFYETQSILHLVPPVVAALHAAGIPTIMIKGVPLALGYYRSPAVRPMRDFDLAVPPDKAREAVAVVQAEGWTRLGYCRDEDLIYRHSMPFRNAAGKEMDLHWHCIIEDGSQDATEWFWSRARPLAVGAAATLQPDATGLLLHAVLHGLRSNAEPPVRWVADAARLIASKPGIDWEELVRFATRRRLTYRLALGLAYVQRRYGCAVPPGVVERLQAVGPSLLERAENTVLLGDMVEMFDHPFGRRWVKLIDYSRMVRIWPLHRVLARLPDYVRYQADVRRKRDLVPFVALTAKRKIRRIYARPASDGAGE